MLPLGNRPVIDWIVADCVRAGMTKIIFVINRSHTQIRQYFSHNAELEAYLTNAGKHEALELVRQPQYHGVHFEFIVQPEEYGTAVPIAEAAAHLGNDETVAVLMGDDFVYQPHGSEVADFIAGWQKSESANALMANPISTEVAQSGRYGLIECDDSGNFAGIIERPSPEAAAKFEAPIVNISKYILSPAVLREIMAYVGAPLTEKEYFITTPVSTAVSKGQDFFVHRINGTYLDAGNPEGWLEANNIIAK